MKLPEMWKNRPWWARFFQWVRLNRNYCLLCENQRNEGEYVCDMHLKILAER